jgi:DNA mismatch repair protein MutS2
MELGLARCDVRGMRADEALREVEQFLDRALREGEASALIVHGHGTGALKGALREYLDASPYVGGYRPGESHEGGDGVTVVTLRG